jgi:hypothetical protein
MCYGNLELAIAISADSDSGDRPKPFDHPNKHEICVKVNRGGTRAPEYVQRVDRTPVQMTLNRKLALVMGKLTAEDAVKSLQNSRRIPELVSVQVVARSVGSIGIDAGLQRI